MKPDSEGNRNIEWLNGFAVNETARNQGIGTKLLEKLLDNVEKETTEIKLITLDRLESAVIIFKKYGFEVSEEK